MRIPWLALLPVLFLAIAGPAAAQTTTTSTTTNSYDVSWNALDPGNGLGRRRCCVSIFPIPGGKPAGHFDRQRSYRHRSDRRPAHRLWSRRSPRHAFVAYTTVINIHRAAETSRSPRQWPELDVRRPPRLCWDHDAAAFRRFLRRPGARPASGDDRGRHGQGPLRQRRPGDRARRPDDRPADGAGHRADRARA